jgi:hypothetical protein
MPRALTIVATPGDVTLLHAAPAFSLPRYISYGAAGAYAGTQALAGGNSQAAIIDIYA